MDRFIILNISSTKYNRFCGACQFLNVLSVVKDRIEMCRIFDGNDEFRVNNKRHINCIISELNLHILEIEKLKEQLKLIRGD